MPELILLVGMHRSGTSALTRVLSLCGGALPRRLLPADIGNPAGYWEPLDAVDADEESLRAHGSSWYDTALPPPERDAAADAELVGRIAELLNDGFAPGGPVLAKEPRIALLLPAWLAAAASLAMPVRIIQVIRNPYDVAASLHARNRIGPLHALLLWLKYNLLGERGARGQARVFVAYERLLADWRPEVERCIARLELPLAIGPETAAAVAARLKPSLRHHRAGAPSPNEIDPEIAGWVARAYEALLGAAETGADPGPALDAVYAEYAGSPHAAGRDWPDPLMGGSAAEETPPAAREHVALGEAETDPRTAELHRLRYRIEKGRHERAAAERASEEERADVTERLAAARAELEELAARHADLQRDHGQLTELLAAARATEHELNRRAAAERDRIDALSARTGELARQIAGLRADFALVREENAQLLGEQMRLKSESLRLQGENARLHAETAQLYGANARLQGENAELTGTNAQLLGANARLGEQTVLLGEELVQREAELAALVGSRSWRVTAPLRRARRAIAPANGEQVGGETT